MGTELSTTVVKHELTAPVWNMIKEMAPTMHASRLFGVSSEDQAKAILVKGYECGFGLANSFDFIQVIQGKPGVVPRGALALIMQSPEITSVKVERLADGKNFIGYQCTMTRGKKLTYTAKFTMEDAKRAGLIKDDSGWTKYPENMCLWRSVGFCADVVAPDITGGMTGLMKAPEAYGVALSEQGDVIDLQPVGVREASPQHTEPTLNDLLDKFTPEQIMEANNGNIPATQDEVNKVAELLSAGE